MQLSQKIRQLDELDQNFRWWTTIHRDCSKVRKGRQRNVFGITTVRNENPIPNFLPLHFIVQHHNYYNCNHYQASTMIFRYFEV